MKGGIIAFTVIITIALAFIILMVANETNKSAQCKTSYPEKPILPPKRTPINELIQALSNNTIDTIILAIALIEQPNGGWNYNYWGVHTDIGRWPYSDLIEGRVCLREAGTGKTREYAGWTSIYKAVAFIRKIIRLKYDNFVRKYKGFDFARFYSEKWRGYGYKSWWNDKFAAAENMLKGV